MSETENNPPNVRVTDRRRFDPEGNARPDVTDETSACELEGQPEQQEVIGDVVSPTESAEVQQLRLDLEAARKRVDELARAFQSLNQDREEFKQRLSRERERMIDVEKGNVAVALVEAVDELDLCLTTKDTSALAKGVKLIRDNLVQKLANMGVERVSLVGKPFDPNVAEAGDMEVTADAAQDQLVVAEIKAGYVYKGRVIRPGRVKVAKYIQPAHA